MLLFFFANLTACVFFKIPSRGGGGGGYLTKFNTGRLRPAVKPLTLLYNFYLKKVYPFHIPTLGSLVLIFMWYLINKLIQP